MEAPVLTLEFRRITSNSKQIWEDVFAQHHYLSRDFLPSARAWLVIWDGQVVGFTSAIPMPSGTLFNAWREHRTVVLPDYQGFGFGVRISEWLGQWFLNQPAKWVDRKQPDGTIITTEERSKLYSRSQHPRLVSIRDSQPTVWRKTGKHSKIRRDWENATKARGGRWDSDTTRTTASHEYLGRDIIIQTEYCPYCSTHVTLDEVLQHGRNHRRKGEQVYAGIVAAFSKYESAKLKADDLLYGIGDLMIKQEAKAPLDFKTLREELLEATGQDYSDRWLKEIKSVSEAVSDAGQRKLFSDNGVTFTTVKHALSLTDKVVNTRLGGRKQRDGLQTLERLVELQDEIGIDALVDTVWTKAEREGHSFRPKSITGDMLYKAMNKPRSRGYDAPKTVDADTAAPTSVSAADVAVFLADPNNVTEVLKDNPDVVKNVRSVLPSVPLAAVPTQGEDPDLKGTDLKAAAISAHVHGFELLNRVATDANNFVRWWTNTDPGDDVNRAAYLGLIKDAVAALETAKALVDDSVSLEDQLKAIQQEG